MSSSKQTTTDQTQSNTLNPQYSNLVYGNVGDVQNLAKSWQPYMGDMVAGFTPAQLQAQQETLALDQNQVGAGALNQAVSGTQGIAGYKPLQVNAPTVTGAQIDPSSVSMVKPTNLTGVDMSGYMNPYIQNVVNTQAAQSQHALQVAENQNTADATKAGAWRGTSLAVQNAVAEANNLRDQAAQAASLYSGGYQQATGNAEQDLARAQAAQQANQGAQLSIAGTNVGNLQQAALANQGASLTAQQANQGAAAQGAQIGLAANQALAGLSTQQLEQGVQRAGLSEAVGSQQQQLNQQELNWAYQNGYLNKQQWQTQMAQITNQAVSEVPTQQTTTAHGTTTEQDKNPLGAIATIASIAAAPFTGGASLAGAGMFGASGGSGLLSAFGSLFGGPTTPGGYMGPGQTTDVPF